MGLFVNPSEELLKRAINSRVYVDKSMLLHELNKLLNTEDCFVCVARPRRFGKTMAGNMIAAYYGKNANSRPILENLKIATTADFETYLNAFNVIKFDVNAFYSNSNKKKNIVPAFTAKIREEFMDEFPDCGIKKSYSIADCIEKIYKKTKEQFVVILDEYDVLVREKAKASIFDPYLDFLNGIFKNADLAPAIALAYLTGILPIVRDKIQSKLNLFTEYTMTDSMQLSEFVGFTEEETSSLCEQYHLDFEECKRWYNGYKLDFLGNTFEIYNPKSVVQAMTTRKFGDYWTKTGSYDSIRTYISMNFEGIKDDVKAMIAGGRIDVNVDKFLNTMTDFHSKDAVFAYLIHLGYLSYDSTTKQCYIPNNEIRSEWLYAIEDDSDYAKAIEIVNNSKILLDKTVECDNVAVANALTAAHEQLMSRQRYNHEACLQCAIRFAYFYANTRYTIISELPAGKGYADVVFIPYVPNVPAMIVELKRNQTTGTALEQIESKQYFNVMDKYHGDLLLVAVNYDEKTNEHTCEIQRFVKDA
ncbi:MAG: AAA family ATPase [Proteobacteria bacterium]|nr:AAA family ATPase [Pseudomonadota bacterium]